MVLAIEGPNCCGKSTFIDDIVTRLLSYGKDPDNIHVLNVRMFMETCPDLQAAWSKRDTLNLADEQVLRMLTIHIELLTRAIDLAKDDNNTVILDRTAPSFYVYQKLTERHDATPLCLYRQRIVPLLEKIQVVYLNIPYSEMLHRMHVRGDVAHMVNMAKDIYARYEHYFNNIHKPNFVLPGDKDRQWFLEQFF